MYLTVWEKTSNTANWTLDIMTGFFCSTLCYLTCVVIPRFPLQMVLYMCLKIYFSGKDITEIYFLFIYTQGHSSGCMQFAFCNVTFIWLDWRSIMLTFADTVGPSRFSTFHELMMRSEALIFVARFIIILGGIYNHRGSEFCRKILLKKRTLPNGCLMSEMTSSHYCIWFILSCVRCI